MTCKPAKHNELTETMPSHYQQGSYLTQDLGGDIGKRDGGVGVSNVYGMNSIDKWNGLCGGKKVFLVCIFTFQHILDQDGTLSNVLVDLELFVIRT